MPGDPLRARHIAENHLENARLVNDVRGMLGFTGEYKGRRVSVMGSGMGIPTISIYAHELFTTYGVESIIRVGSCGAVDPLIKLRDVVIGVGGYASGPAVLAALVLPALVRPQGPVDLTAENLRLLSGLLAAVVAWRTRSVAATTVAGLGALWLLQALW